MINIKKETLESSLQEIRDFIENGDISVAERELEEINTENRSAEWHFLKGCVLTHKGWFHDAQRHFIEACEIDPDNEEYLEAKQSLDNSVNGYSDTWSSTATEVNEKDKKKSLCADSGKVLSCEMCAECVCECFCEGLCEGLGNC